MPLFAAQCTLTHVQPFCSMDLCTLYTMYTVYYVYWHARDEATHL